MYLFNSELLVEAKDCYIKDIFTGVHKGEVLQRQTFLPAFSDCRTALQTKIKPNFTQQANLPQFERVPQHLHSHLM